MSRSHVSAAYKWHKDRAVRMGFIYEHTNSAAQGKGKGGGDRLWALNALSSAKKTSARAKHRVTFTHLLLFKYSD